MVSEFCKSTVYKVPGEREREREREKERKRENHKSIEIILG